MTPPLAFPRAVMRRFALLAVLAVLVTASCSDGDLFSPNRKTSARLALRTQVAPASFSVLAADISRIRLTITVLPDGPAVAPVVVDVAPDAEEWEVPLDVPANSTLSILVELISVVGGVETVEYSGTLPTIHVTSGPQPTPPVIEVFPGPPGNLSITGITISPRDQTLVEGSNLTLSAAVAGGTGTTRVQWQSNNASVASVDANGIVRALQPGRATISVTAGRVSDAIVIDVTGRASRLEISPTNPTLASFDVDQTFTARVFDARGGELSGAAVSWSISDPEIATQVSPGVFRARRNGSATITATFTQGATVLTESTTLTVSQLATTLTIEPTTFGFDALGLTHQFTATATDANGRPVDATGITWTSSNTAVATVSATGLVRSIGNGEAFIRATAGDRTAEARVTVRQVPTTVVITPADIVFTRIGETASLNAEVRDAGGAVLSVPVSWSTATPHIATVNQDGTVTAVGDGTGVIVADAGGLFSAVTVTVQRTPAALRIVPDTAFVLTIGGTQQLATRLVDSAGITITNTDTVIWLSENSNVATVSQAGLVTGLTAGSTQIVARSRGFETKVSVTVRAAVGGLGLVGDEDNFGYGVGAFVPCVFFNNSRDAADLGIFDRELTSGDEIEAWSHDVSSQLPQGAVAAEVIIEIREIFSDGTAAVLEVDGQRFSAITNGPSRCGPPIVHTLRFTGQAAAFANDGIVNLRFIENGDDIGLDWARVTVIPVGRLGKPFISGVTNPRPLTAADVAAFGRTQADPRLASPARVLRSEGKVN